MTDESFETFDHDFLIEENERLRAENERLRLEVKAASTGLPPELVGAGEGALKAYYLLQSARARGDQPHGIVHASSSNTEFDGRVFVNYRTAELLERKSVATWLRHGQAGELPHGLYLNEGK